MKIEIESRRIGQQIAALPRGENAYRACQLVRRNYLCAEEVKILSKMGFDIVEVSLKSKNKE